MYWEAELRLQNLSPSEPAADEFQLTVVCLPPERICAMDLAMDGFSATHKTRMCYAKIKVGFSRSVSQEGVFTVWSAG